MGKEYSIYIYIIKFVTFRTKLISPKSVRTPFNWRFRDGHPPHTLPPLLRHCWILRNTARRTSSAEGNLYRLLCNVTTPIFRRVAKGWNQYFKEYRILKIRSSKVILQYFVEHFSVTGNKEMNNKLQIYTFYFLLTEYTIIVSQIITNTSNRRLGNYRKLF